MKQDYLLIKKALSKDVCNYLCSYAMTKAQALWELRKHNCISPYDMRFGTFGDKQAPNSDTFCIYGDGAFDTLVLMLQGLIEKETKLKLVPNYSYMRIYRKGDELVKHTDRYSCEYSITLFLGGSKWPIYMGGKEVKMNQGDLVIYKGSDIEHWRKPLEGEICFQVFLHYNQAKNSPKPYDGRIAMGTWAETKNLNTKS